MKVKQVSVFVENQPGRLVHILQSLEKRGISVRALSISDTAEFGIVRMIVDRPEEALEALHQSNLTARIDWILSARVPDVPGGLLNTVVNPLSQAGINIKYFYPYIERAEGNKATVVLKADDLEKAESILKTVV